MAQRLRMPIDDFKPTAGYKNAKYKDQFRFEHFGLDGISVEGNRKLYGLGNGTVVVAGLDGINGQETGAQSGCGYVLIVIYDDCINNKTNEIASQTVTYFHLDSMPAVKKGDKVTKKTFLGNYGATGAYVTGAHLHIQFDRDTEYPLYCTGIGIRNHAVLKTGTVDSTEDPCDWLWLDKGQKITVLQSEWYSQKELKNIPLMPPQKALQRNEKQGGNFVKNVAKTPYRSGQTVKNRVDTKF